MNVIVVALYLLYQHGLASLYLLSPFLFDFSTNESFPLLMIKEMGITHIPENSPDLVIGRIVNDEWDDVYSRERVMEGTYKGRDVIIKQSNPEYTAAVTRMALSTLLLHRVWMNALATNSPGYVMELIGASENIQVVARCDSHLHFHWSNRTKNLDSLPQWAIYKMAFEMAMAVKQIHQAFADVGIVVVLHDLDRYEFMHLDDPDEELFSIRLVDADDAHYHFGLASDHFWRRYICNAAANVFVTLVDLTPTSLQVTWTGRINRKKSCNYALRTPERDTIWRLPQLFSTESVDTHALGVTYLQMASRSGLVLYHDNMTCITPTDIDENLNATASGQTYLQMAYHCCSHVDGRERPDLTSVLRILSQLMEDNPKPLAEALQLDNNNKT